MRRLVRAVQRVHATASLQRFSITAMHVHGYLGFELSTSMLEERDSGAYQAVNFETGLFLRLAEPVQCTLAIFQNGHFVVTGCSSKANVRKAIEALYPTLRSCAFRAAVT
jgi:TATA-box binding protein (TBP) (component of TFIID and TFIIIB)